MTDVLLSPGATHTFDGTAAQQHPHRWRLSRAGFVNVWHYYENTFDISGGRLILRGTNGSGKSRALEMLLPFLLDADRRNMGTGSAVRMEDLMSAGAGDQNNRLGYIWLELGREADLAQGDTSPRYLTLGALVRFSNSTKEAKVWYFSTPLRVGNGLPLLGPGRQPLSYKDLVDLVGEERITDGPEKHRERVRNEVFGLSGQLGKERFDGLMKLLHTLRSPDVGNRIEEGKLPAILADALPPLSEDALSDAGQQLDGLTSTREDQERLETAREHVRVFLEVYQRYVTRVLTESLIRTRIAAESVQAAEQNAEDLATRAADIDHQRTVSQSQLDELEETRRELTATLSALKESDIYRSAQELTHLSAQVNSLATAADTALAAAAGQRRNEAEQVNAADTRADEVTAAAAELSDTIQRTTALLTDIGLTGHGLPAAVHSRREPSPPQSDVIRVVRDSEPAELIRPRPDAVSLVPHDLPALADATDQVRKAAQARAVQAGNRAADARALSEERVKAWIASDNADEADDHAREATESAQTAADLRDDTALDLVDRWRAWLAEPTTVDLLGFSDWSDHPLLGVLVRDRAALCGEESDSMLSLSDLDRAASEAAAPALDTLAGVLVRLDDADATDQRRVDSLTAERDALRAERDPEPMQPFWAVPTAGTQLWRCVDFVEGVTDAQRAGIEAALLSSGLLTATVDDRGQLYASDGQLLVSPVGDRVHSPLSFVLRPDPTGPLPADAIAPILERVAFEDHAAQTWISGDGSWGNGPIRGRHTADSARHIGAAARAAARARRLTEIDAELDAVRAAVAERDRRRQDTLSRQQSLREHVRRASRSKLLADARIRASVLVSEALKATATARQSRARADELGRALAVNERRHRDACAQFDLPVDEASLTAIHHQADDAAKECLAVAGAIEAVTRCQGRHSSAVTAALASAGHRSTAEESAAQLWSGWRAEDTRLSVLRASVGAAAADVQHKVQETAAAIVRTETSVRGATAHLRELDRDGATAAAEAANARARTLELLSGLSTQVDAVNSQLAQPGVAETAFARPTRPQFADPSPTRVEADAAALLGELRRAKTDENALMVAQRTFEQAITGSYDVSATIAAGIRLYELVDADGRRPLAQAAEEIARQCEMGRAALTEREQRVFTDFVLGEVGEELRRRLAQAGALITAMNTSLRSIRTSHNIGVRLTWKLSEDANGDVSRIKELITTATSVRTPTQDNELTDLLSARVAAEALDDPTSGYAAHLRSALDYRAWHVVEVIITGPEEGRERRISRRAKLSQGETRFVSYVTLFAAVDAYLSGLPDTAKSLRLILLDDAFAKVDEPTIAELLGLLVRLDVDFAMTGHALWGCVPQVPALDIYEICREDGSPAATAHVRWDGRNRHLRAT